MGLRTISKDIPFANIYVVDDYMNTKTLQLLSQKKQGVEVILFTKNGQGGKGFWQMPQ